MARNCLVCGKPALELVHPSFDKPGREEPLKNLQLAVCQDPSCGWTSEKTHDRAKCEVCISPTAAAAAAQSLRDELNQIREQLAALQRGQA